jgi:DNA-binding SARP family transcriptional activator/TolB-like protein
MPRLRALGGLSIDGGHVDATVVARRRPLALLALLAVAGTRGLSREKVASLLWPESDEERARNSLSHALSSLRRDLSLEDVVVGGAELRLNDDVISSDVADFERAVAAGEPARAAALYEGPFLDGFFVREAAEFERWTEEQRQRLHLLFIGVLRHLAGQAEQQRDYANALEWWRRLAALEPTNAAAALGAMQALAATGDRAAALKHFQVHEALLRQEYNVEAEPTVRALADRLRAGETMHVATPAVAPDEQSPASPASPLRARARLARWPVVALFAGVLAVGLLALNRRGSDPSPPLNPRGVVVTGFTNRTGDSTLNDFGFLAADWVTDGLQRSGLVDVADPATSLITVTDLRRGKGMSTADEGEMIAEATWSRFVVSGHYSRDGDSIVIVARIADAAQGRLIGFTEPVNVSLDAHGIALEHLRQRVMGLLAVRLDERLRDVLTPGATSPPTLAAYREHVAGLLAFQRQETSDARAHFQRAYVLDSTFVAPLIWEALTLGNAFANAGNTPDRLRVIEQIARRRANLTPLDRHVLEYLEAAERSDPEGQIVSMRQASELAPGSIWTWQLARSLYNAWRFREAIAVFEQIDRKRGWMYKWPPFWQSFVEVLNRTDHRRELEIAREARHTLPNEIQPLYLEARALVGLRRWRELNRVLAEMRIFPDKDPRLGNLLHVLGMSLWTQGDTVRGRALVEEAVAWFRARPAAQRERFAHRMQFATTLLNSDRYDEARIMAEGLLAEQPKEYRALHVLGVAHARLGNRPRAEEVIAQLVSATDSLSWNYIFAAGVAAVLGEQERAVSYLKEYKNRGHSIILRRSMFKDFDGLVDYPPYLAITEPLNK